MIKPILFKIHFHQQQSKTMRARPNRYYIYENKSLILGPFLKLFFFLTFSHPFLMFYVCI